MTGLYVVPKHICICMYLIVRKDILEEEGFDDEAALEKAIKKLETELRKARKTEADGEELEAGDVRRLRLSLLSG